MESRIDWLKKNYPGWEGIGACIATVTEKGKTRTAISLNIFRKNLSTCVYRALKAELAGRGFEVMIYYHIW